MIADFMKIVQEFIGSSYLLRAHGKGGASATILFLSASSPVRKIRCGFPAGGQKGRGWGGTPRPLAEAKPRRPARSK